MTKNQINPPTRSCYPIGPQERKGWLSHLGEVESLKGRLIDTRRKGGGARGRPSAQRSSPEDNRGEGGGRDGKKND